MPALSQHGNVSDTAVALLHHKGYQVWRDDVAELYYAERGGWDFAADDLVGLLGVVAIYEANLPSAFAEYWWRDKSATGAARRLPTQPEREYISVIRRK